MLVKDGDGRHNFVELPLNLDPPVGIDGVQIAFQDVHLEILVDVFVEEIEDQPGIDFLGTLDGLGGHLNGFLFRNSL